jgi:hypothetical protein
MPPPVPTSATVSTAITIASTTITVVRILERGISAYAYPFGQADASQRPSSAALVRGTS